MTSNSQIDLTSCDGHATLDETELLPRLSCTDVTVTALPIESSDAPAKKVSATDSAVRFASGAMIGEFEIRQQIGRGGMAFVYEAWQDSLRRPVALKVLPFWSSTDTRLIARLKNEARALANLEHPNIVPVYAVGEDGGVHYMAMRLIHGAPLDQVVARLRDLRDDSDTSDDAPALQTVTQHFESSGEGDFEAVASLGVSVARALHAAHEYGVVHRDIKPSNILVDCNGRPWVADFGLAHCDTATHLTRTGAFVGTPRYASPEQASGESALVDHRTDVYSLGLTLYELATLGPAFDRTPGRPDSKRYDLDPPRPCRRRADIPADLENIILKAASPVRDERYATARELAEDLERFLAGEPTLARRPGPLERATRWSRRHVRAVVGFTALTTLLLAASILTTGLVFREKVKTEAALAEARTHFRQARTVVDEFGAELTEQLALVPGTEHIRQAILTDTIRYYRSFIDQSEDNSEIHSDLATALNKIALLTEHVGSTEDALAAHKEALNAFQKLCREQPDSEECRANLALCENNIALLLSRTTEKPQAEFRFRRALTLQEQLVATNPRVARFQRELGLSKNNLGMLLSSSSGRWAEAAELYKSAIEHFESAATIEPDDSQTKRYLATSYSNLASIHEKDMPDHAAAALQKSVSVLEALVTAEPHRPEFNRELALSLNNLGALHSRHGDHSASADAYRQASRLQYGLLDKAPQSQFFRRDLAVSENNIGLALARAGNNLDAEEAFRRAIAFQEELVVERPECPTDATSLAGIWNNLGMVLERQDRLSTACDSYEQGINVLSNVYRRSSASKGVRENLSRTCFNYSRALLASGQVDRAVEYMLRRRKLWSDNPSRLLSVAEQLASAAIRVTELNDSPLARISHNACSRLVTETLTQAIDAGLDPSQIRDKNLSDWLCPVDATAPRNPAKADSFNRENV